LFAAGDDEDILVGYRQLVVLEDLGGFRDARFEDVERILGEHRFAELFGGDLDDFRVSRHRGPAEISEDHVAVLRIDLLPFTLGDVEVGLLEVKLGNRGDRGAETAPRHNFGHLLDNLRKEMEGAGVAHHHGVGGQCPAGHGRQGDHRRNHFCFRRDEVVFHRFFEGIHGEDDFFVIEIQRILGALQGMHHRQDIRLTGTAADRRFGQVDAVDAAFDGRQVLGDAETCGIMGVEPQDGVGGYQISRSLQGIIDLSRVGGAGSILKADRMEGDARIEDLFESVYVEFGSMGAAAAGRQFHHGDDNLVLQTVVSDTFAGVFEIADIV